MRHTTRPAGWARPVSHCRRPSSVHDLGTPVWLGGHSRAALPTEGSPLTKSSLAAVDRVVQRARPNFSAAGSSGWLGRPCEKDVDIVVLLDGAGFADGLQRGVGSTAAAASKCQTLVGIDAIAPGDRWPGAGPAGGRELAPGRWKLGRQTESLLFCRSTRAAIFRFLRDSRVRQIGASDCSNNGWPSAGKAGAAVAASGTAWTAQRHPRSAAGESAPSHRQARQPRQ